MRQQLQGLCAGLESLQAARFKLLGANCALLDVCAMCTVRMQYPSMLRTIAEGSTVQQEGSVSCALFLFNARLGKDGAQKPPRNSGSKDAL